jgi:hypothetical protein
MFTKHLDIIENHQYIISDSKRMKKIELLTLLGLAFATSDALACASCGCSLSSDPITGYTETEGWRINLDYTFINQNQLRNGGSVASASQAFAAGQEAEHKTINRYTNLGVTYSPNADWNFKAIVPYVSRSHSTYGEGDPSVDPLIASRDSGLGDIKLLASYQGFLPKHNLGVQVGIKLPTGNYGGQVGAGPIVGRNPTRFSDGSVLDASLQLGTGSTDLIVGAYYYQALSENVDGFVNGQFQTAISQKLDQTDADYRPGNQATLNVGLRYQGFERVTPQLQINMIHKTHDQGALSGPGTAGTVAYLSPGLTVDLVKNVQAYGFVQVPIHSQLSDYQLLPRWAATVGLSYSF